MHRHHAVTLSEVLAGPVGWPKKPEEWEAIAGDKEIVYEDHRVVAFLDPENEEHESAIAPEEIRITLIPKNHVDSLMELGIADETLSAALLYGVQQVALKLGLHKKGFEVRSHVYPPYQRRPGVAFKIRSGKVPKKNDPASG